MRLRFYMNLEFLSIVFVMERGLEKKKKIVKRNNKVNFLVWFGVIVGKNCFLRIYN